MAGLAKTLGPFAGPVPMLLAGKNPLDNPLSPVGMIRDSRKKNKPADTVLGLGGFAGPNIKKF